MKLFLRFYSVFFITCLCGGLMAQTFSNETTVIGASSNAASPIIVDMNQDNLDDIVRMTSGNLVVDYQQADGTFTQTVFNAGITNYPSWSACAGDLNGDGHMDIMCGSGSNASFLLSSADGMSYTENELPEYLFSQRTNIIDIDNDGDLDAFACHDGDESHPYRNDGTGNMVEDQSLINTVPLAGNYASVWVDYDNDGDTDMHMSKCRQGSSPGDAERMNAMYRNNGDGTFTEVAADIGQDDGDQSWVTIFQDFDNDGDFDTYTVNHFQSNLFKLNDGAGNYTVYNAPGIDLGDLNSWAAVGADFDNDGWIDMLVESQVGKQMYHNNGDLTFTAMNMPFDDGALGDLNNDGFIDVFTGNTIWMNDGNDNNYIKFTLEGTVSNDKGIGSRVTIYGDFGQQMREVRSGENFRPMSTLNVHFGLGNYQEVDSVVIQWPSGISTTVESPAINGLNTIPEASCLFSAAEIDIDGFTSICPGESVTLIAPEGYIYDWSNDATTPSIEVSTSGTYSVVLENEEGCLSIPTPIIVEVIQDEAPLISLDASAIFCEGGQVTLTSSEADNNTWSTNESEQSIVVTESGEYTVTHQGQCLETTSESIVVDVLSSTPPEIVSIVADAGESTATVTATGNDITWYEDIEATQFLASGPELVVPLEVDPYSVYATSTTAYPGETQTGGKLDNTGSGGLPSSGSFNFMTVWEPFILNTVTVYVINNLSGVRTIRLIDGNGTVLNETTKNLSGNGAHVIELDWEVPTGTDMGLVCVENNLFRNQSGVNFPYEIGTVGELTNTGFGPTYYYYFYDWQISKMPVLCESEVLPVTIAITDLQEWAAVTAIDIFPNPASESTNISLELAEHTRLQIRLLDVLGAEVIDMGRKEYATGTHRIELDLMDLPAGVYQVQVRGQGKQLTYRLVND